MTHFISHVAGSLSGRAIALMSSLILLFILVSPVRMVADDTSNDTAPKDTAAKDTAVKDTPPKDASVKEEIKWTLLFDGKTLDDWSVPQWEEDKKVEIVGSSDSDSADKADKTGAYIVVGGNDLASGIKYNKPFPKSNYEILYQAKRVKGYDFFGTITFPVKESHCSFVTGGWSGSVIGLSSINGYDASENETTGFYAFKDKQWYQIRVCVTDDCIRVWLWPVDDDGNPDIKKDTGSPSAASSKAEAALQLEIEQPKVDLTLADDKRISTRLEVTPFRPLGISTWNTVGHLRDIKFRELSPQEVERIKLDL